MVVRAQCSSSLRSISEIDEIRYQKNEKGIKNGQNCAVKGAGPRIKGAPENFRGPRPKIRGGRGPPGPPCCAPPDINLYILHTF